MKLALLFLALAANDPRANWVHLAKVAHTQADAAEAAGNLPRARAALMDFLEQPPPAGVQSRDARELQQDAWFCIADIDLALGKPDAAKADAATGLLLGREDDLFTANLLIAHARALELLKDDRGAIADYQEAMRINEKLLANAVKP